CYLKMCCYSLFLFNTVGQASVFTCFLTYLNAESRSSFVTYVSQITFFKFFAKLGVSTLTDVCPSLLKASASSYACASVRWVPMTIAYLCSIRGVSTKGGSLTSISCCPVSTGVVKVSSKNAAVSAGTINSSCIGCAVCCVVYRGISV